MTEKKLRKLEDRCYRISSELSGALANLSSAASEVLGYDVIADLCGGGEIEFRMIDQYDVPDDFSCIRIEDVINKLNSR